MAVEAKETETDVAIEAVAEEAPTAEETATETIEVENIEE